MGHFRPSVEFAVRVVGDEPKISAANTRGQKAYLALGAHHIFCDSCIDFWGFCA